MKKILLLFIMILSFGFVSGQNILLEEGFDAGALPAGWSAVTTNANGATLMGACGTAVFSFDCTIAFGGGFGAGAPAGFSGNVATCNDDIVGNGAAPSLFTMTTSDVDLSIDGGLELRYDWENENAGGGSLFVEVYDGAAWVQVHTSTGDSNGHEDIDISAYTNADFAVRFIYDDDAAWAWGYAIDNIVIEANQPLVAGCELVCPDDITVFLESGDCVWAAEYGAHTEGCDPNYSSIGTVAVAPVINGMTGPFDFTTYPEAGLGPFPPSNTPWISNGPGSIAIGAGLGIGGITSQIGMGNLPSSFTMDSRTRFTGPCPTGEGALFNNTIVNLIAPYDGTLTFDWTYHTDDVAPIFDPFQYFNASFILTNIADNSFGGALDQAGSFTLAMSAGQNIGLIERVIFDARCGARATISNLVFTGAIPPLDGIYTVNGPALGDPVNEGTTDTVTLVLYKNNVPQDTCGFNVTVNANQFLSNDMSCVGHVQPSMDENCQIDFSAGMFLKGRNYSCFDDYTVELNGGYGLVQGPTSVAPGEYEVTVTNINGNSCWSTMTVEDKLPPVVDCDCPVGNTDPNCDVKCYDVDYGSANMPFPTISECSAWTAVHSDVITGDICLSQTLIRTWTVTDEYGMVGTCQQEFRITKVNFSDIVTPQPIVNLTCGSDVSCEGIAALFDNPFTKDDKRTNPLVENHEGWPVGYPTFIVAGHPQKIDNNICNILVSKSDQTINVCGSDCNGNKKVIRTWTYMDWCTNQLGTSLQVIKATDDEKPTFVELEDFTVSTNPWGCEAGICMPIPELHDNCSDVVTHTISVSGGTVLWGPNIDHGDEGYGCATWYVKGLTEGNHQVTYYAEDCCGNVGEKTITLTVVDQTPPVIVTKQYIVVGLTSSSTNGNGIAKIYANAVDNGSHDGCTKVFFELRRKSDPNCNFQGNTTYNADGHPQDGHPNPNNPNYDGDNGEYVKFCCDDLTEVDSSGSTVIRYGLVDVMLRVWDLNGNYNESWTTVRVEDKLAPAIQCPPDVTIFCDMDIHDLSLTGEAQAYSTCGNAGVEYKDVVDNRDACGQGFLIRRWSIPGGNFCDQKITVRLRNPFSGNITWPRNKETSCLGVDPGEPTWIDGACDLIGHSNKRDTFVIEEGGCYKVLIHWTVIDWCQYEENFPSQDPNGNGIQDGIWRKDQIVKVVDETAPELNCTDVMFAVNDNADADLDIFGKPAPDGNLCEILGVSLENVATDAGDCPSEWLKWIINVDTWGDGVVEWRYSSHVNPKWRFSRGNPIEYVKPTASGETVKIFVPEHIGSSMNNHIVTWKVTDGCGNVTACTSNFMVVDKKSPTPYCLNISSALMDAPGCMLDLWAIDFDKASFDNCTAGENLRYTFSDVNPADDPLYNASSRSSARTFTTADLGPTPIAIDVYVWDEKDNYDYCTVMLTLRASLACDSINGSALPMIAGQIETNSGATVDQVHVTLDRPEVSKDMMSNTDGYAFNNNLDNESYTIVADRNTDYMEGVSTLDLLLIQRHILKLKEFDNAYTLFAADIDNSGKINAADLIDLRKLILGKINALPNNASWRFGDKAQSFGDLEDVLSEGLNETISIDLESTDMMHEDFVAVKVGDVDNTIDNLMLGMNTAVRTNKAVTLSTEEQSVVAGQEVAVTFTSADFNEVYGYQTGVSLSGLEFVSVEGGAISMTEANIAINRSNMNISWSANAPMTVSNEGLFTITFLATTNGTLSNMINTNARSLSTEAYVGDNATVVNLNINVNGLTATASNELMQNEPNPFRTTTTVAYELATAGEATMTIYDVTGKIVLTKTASASIGMNEFTVNKSDLKVSGVMYYKLESGDFTATKRMIIIE